MRGSMTDGEGVFFAPFVLATGGNSARAPVATDGFWTVCSGLRARVLSGVLCMGRSARGVRHEIVDYRRVRCWMLAGVWKPMLRVLNEGDGPCG